MRKKRESALGLVLCLGRSGGQEPGLLLYPRCFLMRHHKPLRF